MIQERVTRSGAPASELSTNKVLRNTYMLLSLTLLFSAAMAGVSMVLQVGSGIGLLTLLAGFGVLFAIHK